MIKLLLTATLLTSMFSVGAAEAAQASPDQTANDHSATKMDYCYQVPSSIAALSRPQQISLYQDAMYANFRVNLFAAQDGLPVFDNNAYIATILTGSEEAGVSVPQDLGDYILQSLPFSCKLSPKTSIVFELMVGLNLARYIAGYPTIPQVPTDIAGSYGGQ